MRYIILPAVFMIMVSVAQAEVYQWTDSDNGIHFTDNAEKIPPAYRSKAREVTVTPSIQVMEEPAATVAPSVQSNAPEMYGGHGETWWRTSFNSLRVEIKNIQDGLPGKREQLTELRRKKAIFTYARNREAFYKMDADIKRDEERVANLQQRLADLDDEADRAGVPMNWRR